MLFNILDSKDVFWCWVKVRITIKFFNRKNLDILSQNTIDDIRNIISLTNSTIQNLINSFSKQNIHFKNNNLSQINQKIPNETFLQKKRNFQTNFLFDNSNIILQKNQFFINNSFRINKKDIEQTNYKQNKDKEKLNETIIFSIFKKFFI